MSTVWFQTKNNFYLFCSEATDSADAVESILTGSNCIQVFDFNLKGSLEALNILIFTILSDGFHTFYQFEWKCSPGLAWYHSPSALFCRNCSESVNLLPTFLWNLDNRSFLFIRRSRHAARLSNWQIITAPGKITAQRYLLVLSLRPNGSSLSLVPVSLGWFSSHAEHLMGLLCQSKPSSKQ